MFPRGANLKQRGAGLPIAIFIITVLAMLVASIAQLQESSGQSVSLQIQSQRAFFAAESGAQVGVAEALGDPSICPVGATTNWTVAFSAAALAGCEARISCSSATTAGLGGKGGDRVYSLDSTGECGSGNDNAERAVEVRFR